MNKLITSIVVILIAIVGFFVVKPEPPFGGGTAFSDKISSKLKQEYTITGEKLTKEVSNNPKDRIVLKVGDEAKFKPKIELSRWDEVSFNLELVDVETGTETITSDDTKIIWNKGNKTVNFYEIVPSSELPDGGYEFDITFKKKPSTNKIEFTINSNGVKFFYQPPLTQAQIDRGMERPDNVVGSYAVYASEKKINYEEGKLYRVGKVSHIFRPKIVDSAGHETWGELNIAGGFLTVTIPQEFLDTAIYPVHHAAGLTLGFSGTCTSNTGQTNFLQMSSGTAASSGTVSKISSYGYNSSGTSNNKGALYVLGTRALVSPQSDQITATTTLQWWDYPITGTLSITSGTAYYITSWSGGGTYTQKWDSTDGTYGAWEDAQTYGAWPDPMDAPGSYGTANMCAYATYEGASVPVKKQSEYWF